MGACMTKKGWYGERRRHRDAALKKKWVNKVEVKEGGLGGWKADSTFTTRRLVLNRLVKKEGYATVVRRLNFLSNVSRDGDVRYVARRDMEYLRNKWRSC